MSADVATDMQEGDLAEWLFAGPVPSRTLAEELALVSGTKLVFRTNTRALAPSARGPGDIDVLAMHPSHPAHAVAIEVKRVKMPADSYWTSLPNKLGGIEDGCRQVALLREIGFHRSYLLVAVVADGREQASVSPPFRGPTPGLVAAVKAKLRSLQFHPDVGVFVVEVTQPTEKHIFDIGLVGIPLPHHQVATAIQQPSELTAKIASFCAESSQFHCIR